MAAIGLFLKATIFLTGSNVSRNINLLLSMVPNKLLTALYLQPFIFSNKTAWAPFSNCFKCMAAISKYGSTSSLIRIKCPFFSRSRIQSFKL